MTRLIFRFKRTLVTPTFPASSFTDVSTVPTRRHLSRELTEPSPRDVSTFFSRPFSTLHFRRSTTPQPGTTHPPFHTRVAFRSVPFGLVSRKQAPKDSPKNFAALRISCKFVECCGYQTTLSLASRVNRLSWRWLPPLGENHPFPFPAQLPIQERQPAYISATERRQRVAACSFVQDRRG